MMDTFPIWHSSIMDVAITTDFRAFSCSVITSPVSSRTSPLCTRPFCITMDIGFVTADECQTGEQTGFDNIRFAANLLNNNDVIQ